MSYREMELFLITFKEFSLFFCDPHAIQGMAGLAAAVARANFKWRFTLSSIVRACDFLCPFDRSVARKTSFGH